MAGGVVDTNQHCPSTWTVVGASLACGVDHTCTEACANGVVDPVCVDH